MSKPLSNSAWKRWVQGMNSADQQEVLERQLRVLPRFIMDEVARPNPNEKVIKHLESRLKLVRNMWTDFLVARHA